MCNSLFIWFELLIFNIFTFGRRLPLGNIVPTLSHLLQRTEICRVRQTFDLMSENLTSLRPNIRVMYRKFLLLLLLGILLFWLFLLFSLPGVNLGFHNVIPIYLPALLALFSVRVRCIAVLCDYFTYYNIGILLSASILSNWSLYDKIPIVPRAPMKQNSSKRPLCGSSSNNSAKSISEFFDNRKPNLWDSFDFALPHNSAVLIIHSRLRNWGGRCNTSSSGITNSICVSRLNNEIWPLT